MINQLLLAIILTILPVSELRGGMPLAIDYAIKNNLTLLPIILMIILFNMLIVLFIFLFLDKFHSGLLKFKFYNKFYNLYLKRVRKKVDKFESRHETMGMLALTLFVAIPFPTTGAWTGTFIAWLLDLERKESIIAIMTGVLIAGVVMALASLGFIKLFF